MCLLPLFPERIQEGEEAVTSGTVSAGLLPCPGERNTQSFVQTDLPEAFMSSFSRGLLCTYYVRGTCLHSQTFPTRGQQSPCFVVSAALKTQRLLSTTTLQPPRLPQTPWLPGFSVPPHHSFLVPFVHPLKVGVPVLGAATQKGEFL